MSTGVIRIEFESDWHVGEGAGGAGHIDRLVRRDPEDELPWVPAKTLTGMLRDGCERVARAADGGCHGAWSSFCDRLFGVQSRGATQTGHTTPAWISISAARFAPGLRAALAPLPPSHPLRRALCFIKPGVAIDAQTGIAQDDMLRMEEVVVAGSVLEAEWSLLGQLDPETTAAVRVLLHAGCKVTERLGGKRRRGNGRCRITLPDVNVDFNRLRQPPPELPQRTPATLELSAPRPATAGVPVVCRLDLELVSPVVVPAETLGNVVECRDYIPGALLLPALDSALRDLLGARAAELTALLASGRIQIRNGYPIAPDGTRTLPAPLALEAEKERPGRIRNGFIRHAEQDPIQFKPIRAGFLPEHGLPAAHDESRSPLLHSALIAFTHATIDDGPQRPTAAVGGVYTYFALAPGQRFRAELWLEAGLVDSAEAVCAKLPTELRIGRSKKDDYGRVRLTARPATPRSTTGTDSVGEATLWLVAPLLARDARFLPIADAAALTESLREALGVTVTVLDERCRAHREEGWISAWNEPRPSRIGLAPGSCLRLRFDPPLPRARLAELEQTGFGERRGEGYGELRVDPPLLATERPPIVTGPDAATPRREALPVRPDEFTRALHLRAWRQVLRDFVQHRALDVAQTLGWKDAKPSNSQLGALRTWFEGWTGTEALRRRFAAWWLHLLEIPKRRDQWPNAGHQTIARFGTEPDAVWTALAAAGLAENALPLLPGQDGAELRRMFAAEAARIYWLGVIGAELDRRLRSAPRRQPTREVMTHGA